MRRIAAIIAASLLLVGCGASAEDPDANTLGPDDSTSAESTTDGATADTDPQQSWDERYGDLSDQERAAVEDLAERLSLPYYRIFPQPLEEVTWPNGAIGCPAPGQSYTQALVEGYRLILTHDGEEYAYHAAEDGELFYCADPAGEAGSGTETE
ncbi:hypothetical protein [Ruania rhizosphaerae]|uniref:hypothetical protein n=1 Tax=Ruania rhizosphaerae TaxID=1840413 RepID=UPI00135BE0E3|nr:hypothetical protein [Ruania rhizosphaerae]